VTLTQPAPVFLDTRPEGVPAGSAAARLLGTDIAGLRRIAETALPADVGRALSSPRPTLADVAALLSPAARPRLEDLAAAAHQTGLEGRQQGGSKAAAAPARTATAPPSSSTTCLGPS